MLGNYKKRQKNLKTNMADETEPVQTIQDQELEEVEIYDERVYNQWVYFQNCTINSVVVRSYGRPVTVPPPPPGGPINP